MEWLYLSLAIIFEILATSSLKLAGGGEKLWYALGSVVGYVLCFWLLSLALEKIELGIAYAIWSAMGITVLAVIGIVFFNESLSLVKVISLCLIIAGVIGLNLSGGGH